MDSTPIPNLTRSIAKNTLIYLSRFIVIVIGLFALKLEGRLLIFVFYWPEFWSVRRLKNSLLFHYLQLNLNIDPWVRFSVKLVRLQSCCLTLGLPLCCLSFFCDNQSTIHIAKNPAFHELTKHIDLVYHFVRTKPSDGLISLYHTSSSTKLNDILTKCLSKVAHHFYLGKLGVVWPSNLKGLQVDPHPIYKGYQAPTLTIFTFFILQLSKYFSHF